MNLAPPRRTTQPQQRIRNAVMSFSRRSYRMQDEAYMSQGDSPAVDFSRHDLYTCGMICPVQKTVPIDNRHPWSNAGPGGGRTRELVERGLGGTNQ
jgi:hypothetical protein